MLYPAQEIIQKYPELMAHAEWCDCPRGWLPLVDALCAELTEKFPGARCLQFKEKFGQLRFYLEEYAPEVDEVVKRYVAECSKLCQECGAPGEAARTEGWIRTACAAHRRRVT